MWKKLWLNSNFYFVIVFSFLPSDNLAILKCNLFCKHYFGLCFLCKLFHVAVKNSHIKGWCSELSWERHSYIVLMGIKMSRLTSCLWNFDLVASKRFFMWGSVILSAPLLSLEQRTVKNQYAAGDKSREIDSEQNGNKWWRQGKYNVTEADMLNSVTPLIILTFLSTRGSGWDHSTQTITLLHHDRWSHGVLWWAGVSPLVKRE